MITDPISGDTTLHGLTAKLSAGGLRLTGIASRKTRGDLPWSATLERISDGQGFQGGGHSIPAAINDALAAVRENAGRRP